MTEQEKQTDADTSPSGGPAQRTRWVVYGSNVVIFCIAAIAIAIILNWLSATQLAGRGEYTRYDLTATRAYSLSPQTRKLLESLDTDLNIVLLYAAGTQSGDMMGRVEDLLDEYRSRSSRITVTQIDPNTDPAAFDKLIDKLLGRYDDEVKASKLAIADTEKVLGEVKEFADKQGGALGDVLTQVDRTDTSTIQMVQQLGGIFQRLPSELERLTKQIHTELKGDLPDYGSLTRGLETSMRSISDRTLDAAIAQFRVAADSPKTPDLGKDTLLGLIKQYEAMSERIKAIADRLAGISFRGYNQLRAKIDASNGVILYTDAPGSTEGADAETIDRRGVTALTLDEIYPIEQLRVTDEGALAADRSYEGEETLTGAILQLTQQHRTKVVFINPARRPVLMGRGQESYSVVAARLRKMNFIVSEWQPAGSMGPGGRPMPPTAPPTAEPGQTMVLIYLPDLEPPNPQQPFNPAVAAAGRAIAEHISAGRPALLFTAPALFNAVSPQDPISQVLTPFGIAVDRNAIILTRVPTQGGTLVSDNRHQLDEHPAGHPIADAIGGLNALVFYGQPVALPASPPEGVTVAPLLTTPDDTWAESDLSTVRDATKDTEDKAGPFTVAAAIERADQRLVVIGDPVFATNSIVGTGQPARFPGNGELFTNSIYWLAGLDEMIAPGARTQDTRRIAAISPGTMRGIWWALLAGLPLLCLLLGVAVYTIRRR